LPIASYNGGALTVWGTKRQLLGLTRKCRDILAWIARLQERNPPREINPEEEAGKEEAKGEKRTGNSAAPPELGWGGVRRKRWRFLK